MLRRIWRIILYSAVVRTYTDYEKVSTKGRPGRPGRQMGHKKTDRWVYPTDK